ncbi:unnamed protein product [Protopolystoma xenopodis]|uniref:Uncharacterized protein n=1 Tax=Protopolystoma xenopodis TaxID=117903 RepID=A0A3S5CBL3_9PLAT|nr:unnamed protein product [Protopolystoma xenopodis]
MFRLDRMFRDRVIAHSFLPTLQLLDTFSSLSAEPSLPTFFPKFCGNNGGVRPRAPRLSGAELPSEAKWLLGKKEIYSLRAGIDLLRRFNWDIEVN